MTSDQIQGIIRNVLMFVGGLAVSKGYVDNVTMVSVVGALVTLFGFGWSFVHLGSLSKPAA